MDARDLKAASIFIEKLTATSSSETRKIIEEVEGNERFHKAIEDNYNDHSRRPESGTRFSVNTLVGAVFYVLCRQLKPESVVEAGVASGVSTSYFLCGLDKNKKGQLYSIDQPWWDPVYTGWLVPGYLKVRWHLVRGKTADKLQPLLGKLKHIDIYFHDSEHTYENMMWEYENAWAHLNSGGVLLSHNIDFTEAFPDFCRHIGQEGKTLENLGGLVKS